MRESMLRVCGVATSNKPCATYWILASIAVSFFGVYVEDTQEQKAMLEVVEHIISEYHWPLATVATELRSVWGIAVTG